MEELITKLIKNGILHSQNIIDAFRAVDRANFVPETSKEIAHEDVPIYIGHQQTISQPSVVAFMLELLNVKEGDVVLDIGSGTGWTTALIAHIVGERGTVLGIERIQELVVFGTHNLGKYPFTNARIEQSGTIIGKPHYRVLFDKILVSAAAQTFPEELLLQVKERGVIVIPIGDTIQRIMRIEHQPLVEKFSGYAFVPLILENT